MKNDKIVKVKKLHPDAIGIKMPAIEGDVGYDIYSFETKTIQPHSSGRISTKVSVELPKGYWLEIMCKSGLATKHNITVHNGVVDNGYRGELVVFVYNESDKPYTFHKNDKLAQAIIRESLVFDIKEVDELSDTDRGSSGFGSTGK